MPDKTIEKFSKIKTLKCVTEVVDRLLAGYPTQDVARFIQQERREYQDVTRESLTRMLALYRESMLPADLIAPRIPHAIIKAKREFDDRMQELRRLERLYDALEYRFDISHGEERVNGAINPIVEKQAKEIRDTVMRMHDIKMDLGLVGSRDLGTVTVSPEKVEWVRREYGDKAAVAFSDPVSRGRVLAAYNAVMEAAGVRDEEGNIIQSKVIDIGPEKTGVDE